MDENKVETEKEKDILKEQEKLAEQNMELVPLTAENAVFTRTEGGFVAMEFNGASYKRVVFHRSFPFSDPSHFISVREPEGKELGMILDMAALPKETRELLEEQMNYRYFSPVIQKIVDIKEEYGYSYWQVITDRGAVRFTVPMGGNVLRAGEFRLFITDIDGNRFEVPDYRTFSVKEQKKLDLYI